MPQLEERWLVIQREMSPTAEAAAQSSIQEERSIAPAEFANEAKSAIESYAEVAARGLTSSRDTAIREAFFDTRDLIQEHENLYLTTFQDEPDHRRFRWVDPRELSCKGFRYINDWGEERQVGDEE